MEETRVYENGKKCRCVYAPQIARVLIRDRKYKVEDIKPNRVNPAATVFLFEETDEFNRDFEYELNEYNRKKEAKRLNKLQRETFLKDNNTAE